MIYRRKYSRIVHLYFIHEKRLAIRAFHEFFLLLLIYGAHRSSLMCIKMTESLMIVEILLRIPPFLTLKDTVKDITAILINSEVRWSISFHCLFSKIIL